MIHVAVISKDEKLKKYIADCLEKCGTSDKDRCVVHTFERGLTVTDRYRCEYDILFLDLDTVSDGMEAAHEVRTLDEAVAIVLLASCKEDAVKGYDVAAEAFLPKPFTFPTFRKAYGRILAKVERRREEYLFLKQKGGARRIAYRDIYYIECMGHRLIFHTRQGTYERSGTMKETEDRFSAAEFVRCNRCYLVNLSKVDGVLNDYVLIEEDELKISRPYKIPFLTALVSYYEC